MTSANHHRTLASTLVLLAALLSVGVAGCTKPEVWETEDPAEALRTFVAATYRQRGDIAWHFLTPEVQTELTKRAEAINAKAGGELIKPQDLVMSSGFIGAHHIARLDKKEVADDSASFVLKTHDGMEYTVAMRRVDAVWRVDTGALAAPMSNDPQDLQPEEATP